MFWPSEIVGLRKIFWLFSKTVGLRKSYLWCKLNLNFPPPPPLLLLPLQLCPLWLFVEEVMGSHWSTRFHRVWAACLLLVDLIRLTSGDNDRRPGDGSLLDTGGRYGGDHVGGWDAGELLGLGTPLLLRLALLLGGSRLKLNSGWWSFRVERHSHSPEGCFPPGTHRCSSQRNHPRWTLPGWASPKVWALENGKGDFYKAMRVLYPSMLSWPLDCWVGESQAWTGSLGPPWPHHPPTSSTRSSICKTTIYIC